LKVLHGIDATEATISRFEEAIHKWAKLKHINIQPLYGIVANMGPFIHIVSPWQDNGNLIEYLRKQMSGSVFVDKTKLVSDDYISA